MLHLRNLAVGAALGLGLAVTPTTSAQPAVDQRAPGPADPRSPGALVVPDAAKDEMEKMRSKETPKKSVRDPADAAGKSDGRAGSDARDGANRPLSPAQER